MPNIVIANEDRREGEQWKSQLLAAKCENVIYCDNISALVYTLSRENIHIVAVSVHMIKQDVSDILRSITTFFPRIHIVVIGNMPGERMAELLNGLENVAVRNVFSTDIIKYWSFPELLDQNEDLPYLLSEHFISDAEVMECYPEFIRYHSAPYCVISVRITTSSHAQALSEMVKEDGPLKKINAEVICMSPTEICIVLSRVKGAEVCYNCAISVRHLLLQSSDASFNIGISRIRERASELYVCRKEALRAATAHYQFGRDSIIHIEYLSENDFEYAYPLHKEKKMIEQAMDGNKEGALNMLNEIFVVLGWQRKVHPSLVNKVGLGIVVRLNIAAISRGKYFEMTQTEAMNHGSLFEAKTTEEVYAFLEKSISHFADEIDALYNLRKDALYMRLVDMKSSDTPIDIKNLADTFRTTIAFLNSAVTQNSTENIFDYIRV